MGGLGAETRVQPVPDPAEKPQPFSAVGLLHTRTSQSLGRQADRIFEDTANLGLVADFHLTGR